MLRLHSLSKTTFDSEHISAHESVCTSSRWWNSQPSSTALSLLDCQVGLVGSQRDWNSTFKFWGNGNMGRGHLQSKDWFYKNWQIKMILWHSFEEGKCEQTPNQGELRASLPSWVGTGNDQDWQRTSTWRCVLLTSIQGSMYAHICVMLGRCSGWPTGYLEMAPRGCAPGNPMQWLCWIRNLLHKMVAGGDNNQWDTSCDLRGTSLQRWEEDFSPARRKGCHLWVRL